MLKGRSLTVKDKDEAYEKKEIKQVNKRLLAGYSQRIPLWLYAADHSLYLCRWYESGKRGADAQFAGAAGIGGTFLGAE